MIRFAFKSGIAAGFALFVLLVVPLLCAAADADTPVVSADGTVLVNGLSADSSAVGRHQKKVVTEDGTFVRDEQNRVISTESPDGKLKRSFVYGDAKDPKRVTAMTENGLTYKFVGASKVVATGETVKREGYEIGSYSVYDASNRFTNKNWYGCRTVSPEGVYIEYDDSTSKLKFEDGSGKALTKEQAESRDKDGIWPSRVSIARPDGSAVEAELRGTVVLKLVETRSESGKTVAITWTKSGDSWTSDEVAVRQRTALKLALDGNLSYAESDGTLKVESKNGDLLVTKGGVKTTFDRFGDRVKVETADGVLSLEYVRDAKNVSTLTKVRTKAVDKETSWSRVGTTDEWTADGKTELRKELKILADGSLQFIDKDGEKVKETTGLQRIYYDANGRPELVSFPSAAERKFVYDKVGLERFGDHVPTKDGGTHDLTWQRDSDGSFVSTRDGKVYRREQVVVTDDADVKYVSSDKQSHEAKVRDIDRIARGEFVLSSESVLEARNRLVDAVKSAGLNEDRFNKWIKEFEEHAADDKVAPEKIVKTMNNLSDILTTAKPSPNFDKTQLKTIVETSMHNVARYLEIDQGSHPTCNVTSIEVVACRIHPDEYTRLLKEVCLTGTWKTSEGTVATPPNGLKGTDPDGKPQVYNTLKPGKDEVKYDVGKPDTGDRNLASQVFQMTLINAMYETGHMNTVKDGKIVEDRSGMRYLMGPNRVEIERNSSGQVVSTLDLGEDLLMKADMKPLLGNNGKPAAGGPGMNQSHVIESAKLLFNEVPEAIECTGYYDDPQLHKRVYNNDLPTKQRLLDLKKNGKMPILCPTMGGLHAQTIHDVWEDAKSGVLWILLDNQHGEPEVKGKGRTSGEGDGDGWITLEQLHKTLQMPAQGAGLGQPIMPAINKYSHPSKEK